jgi:hypothetical protein
METTKETQKPAMKAEPQKEHEWLHKLIGDWTYESEASMGPDQPVEKVTGSESVRSLGGIWVIAEGEGEMPGGGTGLSVMSLGYDSQNKRFVGTWIGSMMTNLWVSDGELNGETLTLNSEGPDWNSPGQMANYRDVIEFKNDDHRTLTAHVQGTDGKWNEMMTVDYRRKK